MNFVKPLFRRKKNILVWAKVRFGSLLAHMLFESGNGKFGSIMIFDPDTGKFYMFNADRNLAVIDRLSVPRVWREISLFLVGIGSTYGYARNMISRELIRAGREPISVISPASVISSTARVGLGCIVMPGVVVQHFVDIGNFVILNSGRTLEHEVSIGVGCHIMSNGVVNGRARINDFCSIGSNATIFPEVHVGTHAFIGAGAIVRKDIEPGDIVVGAEHRTIGVNSAQFDQHSVDTFFQMVS